VIIKRYQLWHHTGEALLFFQVGVGYLSLDGGKITIQVEKSMSFTPPISQPGNTLFRHNLSHPLELLKTRLDITGERFMSNGWPS